MIKIGAGYSTVNEKELLSKIVPLYQIEDPTSCQFWQRGINDTYRLKSANAIYSLRVYRHNLRTSGEIDFEISALNHLDDRGVNVARPIIRKDGCFVTEIQSPEGLRHVIITTHAEGKDPDYDDSDNGRLFGESVADLHNRSSGFKSQHTRPRLDIENLLDTSLNVIFSYLDQGSEDLKILKSTATDLRHTVNSVDQKKLDIGFCHGDCHGSNVHLHNGSLMHFDFDCCGFGFRVFELATFKWGISGNDNEEELWSKFLEGYRSQRDITPEDLSLVGTFVVIRQLWWMALIMGNARDFGYRATSNEFIAHHVGRVRKLVK